MLLGLALCWNIAFKCCWNNDYMLPKWLKNFIFSSKYSRGQTTSSTTSFDLQIPKSILMLDAHWLLFETNIFWKYCGKPAGCVASVARKEDICPNPLITNISVTLHVLLPGLPSCQLPACWEQHFGCPVRTRRTLISLPLIRGRVRPSQLNYWEY